MNEINLEEQKEPIYTQRGTYYFYIYFSDDTAFGLDCYDGIFSFFKDTYIEGDEKVITREEFFEKVSNWDYFIENNLLKALGFDMGETKKNFKSKDREFDMGSVKVKFNFRNKKDKIVSFTFLVRRVPEPLSDLKMAIDKIENVFGYTFDSLIYDEA